MNDFSQAAAAAAAEMLIRLAPQQAAQIAAPFIPRLFAAASAGDSFIRVSTDEAQQLQQAAPVCGADFAPLVLRGNQLFLGRFWQLENDLAAQIARLSAYPVSQPDTVQAAARLAQWFADSGSRDQQAAAALTLLKNFMLISGGPGTGKTTTVAKLLALLCQDKLPRIALAAPTGKAAARMSDALHNALAKIEGLDATAAAHLNALGGQTVHRLLGLRPPQMLPEFHAGNRLPLDVLIVDEASMLDTYLLLQLLRALPDSCRVLLLGDADQLPSVGAGAVLSELMQLRGLSEQTAQQLRLLLPQGWNDTLSERSARLTVSHRFGADSGIGETARAVIGGNGTQAWAQFERFPAELSVRSGSIAQMAAALYRAHAAYWQAVDEGDFAAAFEHQTDLTVLTVLRNDTAELNAAYRRELLKHGRGGDVFFAGQMLMISRNDRTVGLYNGDIGLVLPYEDGLAAFFADGSGLRSVALSRLPEHEDAFALTVHKSQGSEYREVWLLPAENDSQTFTRALLYTAITRAKQRFAYWGGRSGFQAACANLNTRQTALAECLAQYGA